jgi:hypothetical protein
MDKFLVERNKTHQEIPMQLNNDLKQLQEINQKINRIASKEERMVGDNMKHP